MSVKDRTTKMANFSSVTPREIDFVTRFNSNWDALRNILGIMRPIKKAPGTTLRTYTASVTLQPGTVAEGDEIPYSLASVTEAGKADITIEKYAKAVTVESVAKYGAEIAVEKTDDAFLNELQSNVLTRFYTFLNTGALTLTASTWQDALARAKGAVLNRFATMRKTVTDVVGFANINDAYAYMGAAPLSVQTQFGISYVKNFLGYSTLFLCPDVDIAQGKVIALPVENIDLYYIDPSDSDFAKLGLEYTVQGETNLIGFHVEGKYSHAVGECYALMGMALWAEYLDGIAVATVGGSTTTITGTSGAATNTTGATKITITAPSAVPADWTVYAKAASGTAPSAPSYGTILDTTGWTKLTLTSGVADDVTGFTSGHKMTIVGVNGTGQVVGASESITVVVKA
jgi:hypothetical protein